MKNLFDYATKELSQDAFLIWLFENYDDQDIGMIAKKLLCSLINLYDRFNVLPNDISDVSAKGQCEKMDIVIDFKLKGETCIMVIEDKIVSYEHDNQLVKYKSIVLNKWNVNKHLTRPSFFVYYKTHDIDENERRKIIDSGWKNFEFDSIKLFWKQYQNSNNLIILQYAKHIVDSWNDSRNKRLPKINNIDQWTGFFNSTLKNKIIDDCVIWVASTFYGYAYFCVTPKSNINENLPYFEIRSRDCVNGQFEARILMYGVDIKYLEPIRKIIRKNETNHIFKGNYGSKQNKQVAHTFRNDPKFIFDNEEEFINLANQSIKEYLKIMKEFFNELDTID